MWESTQPDREEFQKLLSAAYFLQSHSDSGRHGKFREEQGRERACQHAEVLSKVLALRTLFELEQLNFERAAQATVKFAIETLQCHGAAIGLVEESDIRYCASSGRSLIRSNHMALTTSPSALCIQSKAAFVSVDVPRDERLAVMVRNIGWLRSLVVVPIFHGKNVGGTLEMYFIRSRAFEEEDINTYEILGILIGKALLADMNDKIRHELESERAETNARLEQLRPQLELLSGRIGVSECNERDAQVRSPQDGLRIPQARDLTLSSATPGPKDLSHPGLLSDCALGSAVNSELDPISALLITERQIPTHEVSTVVASGETVCDHTAPISAIFSPTTTMQEALPKTSKIRAIVSRKDSVRWRANFYLAFASVVTAWSLFVQGHEARVLPMVSDTEKAANTSVMEKKVLPASHNGSPGATVWVDLRHLQYYCSDSSQYGRTQHGEFMAQSEAQFSQYQPARHRCD